MINKFVRVFNLLGDGEVRNWLLFKLLHPGDKAPELVIGQKPPYLKSFQVDIKLPATIELPVLPPVEMHGNKLEKYELASTKVPIAENFFSCDGETYVSLTDPEDREALYRMSGLIKALEKNGLTNDYEKIIDLWLNEINPGHEDKGAYTIAERMANLGIFLARTRVHEQWSAEKTQTFLKRIAEDAEYLFNHLEYMGEDLTSNHLTNNGRGLLWAALILRNRSLYEIGHKIVSEEVSRIVQNDGMIREGSSHYQFLYTRNIFESLWISRQFESNQDLLKGICEKLVKGCQFFLVGDTIPFFGDISPDYSPAWFLSVASCLESEEGDVTATGWSSHFFKKIKKKNFNGSGVMDEYCRIEKDGWTVFSRYNSKGYPLINGHVHCDSAAPIAFYKGKKVLFDLGRPSYNREHDKYKEVEAHCGFKINNVVIERPIRGFYGDKFLQSRFDPISRVVEGDSVSYSFGNNIRRTLAVTNGNLECDFHTSSQSNLEIFFFHQNDIVIEPGQDGEIESISESTQYSHEYGRRADISYYSWKGQVSGIAKFVVRVTK